MCNLVMFFRNITICPITSTCLCIVLITYSTLQSKRRIEDYRCKFRSIFILLTWVVPIIVVSVSHILVLLGDGNMEESVDKDKYCLTKSMVHKLVMGFLVGIYELFTIVVSIIIIIKLRELSKYFVEKDLTRKVIWKITLYIIGLFVFLTIVMFETPLPFFAKIFPDGVYIVGRIALAIANPILLGLFVWNRQVQKQITQMFLCQKNSGYGESMLTKSSDIESTSTDGMKVELDMEFEKHNDSMNE